MSKISEQLKTNESVPFKRFKATKPDAEVRGISWTLIVLCELYPYMPTKRGGFCRQERLVKKIQKIYMETKPGAGDWWKIVENSFFYLQSVQGG